MEDPYLYLKFSYWLFFVPCFQTYKKIRIPPNIFDMKKRSKIAINREHHSFILRKLQPDPSLTYMVCIAFLEKSSLNTFARHNSWKSLTVITDNRHVKCVHLFRFKMHKFLPWNVAILDTLTLLLILDKGLQRNLQLLRFCLL